MLLGLQELLAWLSGADGGAFIVIAAAAAWAVEYWPKWATLPPTLKSFIVLGVSVLLGLASYALSLHPEVVLVIEPWFRVVMYPVMAWVATQGFHRIDTLRVPKVA